MFSQADLKTISTVFGKTTEELSGALSSENEVSLDLRLPGKIYTQEEIDAKTKANQDAYIEIGYKKIAKEAGLELDAGEKTPESIVSKLKTGLESQFEKKYKNYTPTKELTEAIQRAADFENKFKIAKETIDKVENEKLEINNKFNDTLKEISVKEKNNTILSLLPEKMGIDRGDALTIINSTYQFEDSEEGTVVKRDGKLVLSPTGDNEAIENIVSGFVEEKGWAKASGTGGGDRGNGMGLPSGMKEDDAVNYIIDKGIEPMSAEGSKMFTELTSK